MPDLSDTGIKERARMFLRGLNDAMKHPRGDYYQGDIADPNRTLHMIESAFIILRDAAYAEWESRAASLGDCLNQELREHGPVNVTQVETGDDMRDALRLLVDLVRRSSEYAAHAEQRERDAQITRDELAHLVHAASRYPHDSMKAEHWAAADAILARLQRGLGEP